MRSPFRAPASTRRGARWSRCEPYVARSTEKRNSSDVAHDLVGALLNMGDGEAYRIVTCASIMRGASSRLWAWRSSSTQAALSPPSASSSLRCAPPSQCEAFRMSGKINVLEYEDRLVFKNEGTFIPETIEAALESGYKPPYCRMAISAGMGECLPLTTSRAKPTSRSSACSTGFCLSRMVFIPPLRLELV